jgi:ribosomal-protein-alanine N-acetyltransferase
MSAVLKQAPQLAPMAKGDLDAVLAIEQAVYTHPWTRELVGYFVLLCAAGEAHLLNLSIAQGRQRRGHGAALLREAMRVARENGAKNIFLEVRPSNLAGKTLYERFGFKKIALRRGYYPAQGGREDALVLSCAL